MLILRFRCIKQYIKKKQKKKTQNNKDNLILHHMGKIFIS